MASPLDTIGQYDLLEKIGEGGTGIVYRGRHWETKELVAVKVMHLEVAKNPVLLKRFEQEFRIAHRLDHPNIVRALQFSGSADRPFMVMEYVEGESLGTRLQREGPLPEAEALAIIAQIGEALQCAHDQGLIHRDVKPDNVLVTPGGQAKLTDLGLAKERGSTTNLTQAGRGLGTPNFTAPEQFRDARNVGVQADVYGLAATLYMAVTGALPFGQEILIVVMTRKLRDELAPPRELAPGLSDWTDAVLRRALSADPARRPTSCRAFLDELHGEPAPLPALCAGPTAPLVQEITAQAEERGTEAVPLVPRQAAGLGVLGEVLLFGGIALLMAGVTWYFLFR
jgi:serine/threonine protein kinase